MTDHTLHVARVAVLSALHSLRGVGTAEAIRMRSKLSPTALSVALMSLEQDQWLSREGVTRLHSIYRLTPDRRREAAQKEADHA